MNTNIAEAESRMRSITRDCYDAIRSAGYAYVVYTKPHTAINHFLESSKPPQLYKRFFDIIYWQECENFHKNYLNRFVREAAVQAKMVQPEYGERPASGHP